MTAANAAPTVSADIEDMTLALAAKPAAMDMDDYFDDTDAGDTLTYTATSDKLTVIVADIPDGSSMLSLIVVGSFGEANVTVTATDAAGADATQTFKVTVANQAPMADEDANLSVSVNQG